VFSPGFARAALKFVGQEEQDMSSATAALAVDGGEPFVKEPLPGALLGVTEVGDEEIAAVTKVLKRQTIFRFLNENASSESAQLEAAYRRFCGVKHALAVGGGGTCALISALVGLDVASGDEVIVPGYTYIASAAACLSVGAIPVLAEIDESLTIDVADVEKRITPYTRAIMPVHMRGTPCDMDALMDLARRRGLKVLEDCAQANGGTYHGRPLGSIGEAGAFSLQHYKIITAGEGGVVTTDDENVYRRAAMKHDSAMHFWQKDAVGETFAGENFRMCEMRAALGLVQFGRMPALLERCRRTKKRLREKTAGLKHLRLQPLPCAEGDCGITFIFFLDDAQQAQRFSNALAAEGVPNGTIYNKQIPDRHIYSCWDYVMEKRTSDHTGWPWTAAHRPIEYRPDMLPRTLDILGRCISIGLSQHWTDRHADLVAGAVGKVHDALAAKGQLG
jgi:8-amino-3,8-dideoxy-alpha-D-manno-octulosonate transaminase